jgi:Ferritin-like domain
LGAPSLRRAHGRGCSKEEGLRRHFFRARVGAALPGSDAGFVTPLDMLAELRGDNLQLTKAMRETHELCDEYNDVATASLIEVWIDEAERRTWFLYEASRHAEEG